MHKINGVNCPHCDEDLYLDNFDTDTASIYMYCHNSECTGHKNELTYFISLDMSDIQW